MPATVRDSQQAIFLARSIILGMSVFIQVWEYANPSKIFVEDELLSPRKFASNSTSNSDRWSIMAKAGYHFLQSVLCLIFRP